MIPFFSSCLGRYLLDANAISFSGSTDVTTFPAYSTGYASAMSARWRGYTPIAMLLASMLFSFDARYLRPRYAQVYTFYLTTLANTQGVALAIDDINVSRRLSLHSFVLNISWRFVPPLMNSQVISALATPTAGAETSGTFYFKQPELFYDIKVEFQSSASTKALLLQWETSINTRTVAKSVIPTFRLFFQAHFNRAPQQLTVEPSIACATRYA